MPGPYRRLTASIYRFAFNIRGRRTLEVNLENNIISFSEQKVRDNEARYEGLASVFSVSSCFLCVFFAHVLLK